MGRNFSARFFFFFASDHIHSNREGKIQIPCYLAILKKVKFMMYKICSLKNSSSGLVKNICDTLFCAQLILTTVT